jgi:hypothetical protein
LTQPNPEQQSRLVAVESSRPKEQPKFLQIRDLGKFQHYRDRNPPWVKLYVSMLFDDYEFQQLSVPDRYVALCLIALASKLENRIPNDPAWVSARIMVPMPINLSALEQSGFLEPWRPRLQEPGPGEQLNLPEDSGEGLSPAQPAASGDASNMLATCYQPASTETEAETKAEAHTETDTAAASAGVCVCCGLKVFSRFTLAEAFSLAREWKRTGKLVGGRPVENPGGLARKLHIEGTADTEIEEFLHPPAVQPKRPFTDQPCSVCFGSKSEVVQGKGARPCPHCIDEQGQRTGREPI